MQICFICCFILSAWKVPGNIEASDIGGIFICLYLSHDIECVICSVCWHDNFCGRGEVD